MEPTVAVAAHLEDVRVARDGRPILDGITWQVRDGERWIVMGRNGCGKTTLLRVLAMYLHPTAGSVTVLGETLGRTDVRHLRRRIGVASAALADQLRPSLTPVDIVMTAKHAALEPWWHEYSDADRTRAVELLDRLHIGSLASRTFATLSSGERQRVLLARTLMTDPGLLLFDEPTAGLDMAGREEFVAAMTDLAADPQAPPIVSVTHHVEEIPPGFTHLLLLRDGAIVAAGPLTDLLTSERLSATFGLPLVLEQHGGRWTARA